MCDFTFRLPKTAALRLALVALAALMVRESGRAALTELVSLGSATYAIDAGISSGTYTQSADGVIYSPKVYLAESVGGTFALGSLDWSSFSGLQSSAYLKISFSGANPNLFMSLELFDSTLSSSIKYQGTTDPTVTGPADPYFKFTLTSGPVPSGFLSSLGGAQITWDGDGAVNATLHAIASETAPSPPQTGGSFTASAPGGVRFINLVVEAAADPNAVASDHWTTNEIASAMLPPGSTSWSVASDSNAKTDITAVDHREMLRDLSGLPVTAWQYAHDQRRRYVGPMAQDFRACFGLGHGEKHISTLDADGVALSAVKGLIAELQERKDRSAAQARRLADLEAELRALYEKMQSNVAAAE